MKKDEISKFYAFLEKYKTDYEAFGKLYPNKVFENETQQQNSDPYLNILSDVSLYILHLIELTHEQIQEKTRLKLSCQSLKNFLAPMPPIGLIQFSNQVPCFIPKQSKLDSSPMSLGKQQQELFKEDSYDHPKVKFKNCYDVSILPIRIDRIKQRDQNSISVEMNSTIKSALSFEYFGCPNLTFYINERPENAALIYDILFLKVKNIEFEFENKETNEKVVVKISKDNIKPLGFEPEEFASHVSNDDNAFFSLLKDYLFFNTKFMFFKLELPESVQNIKFHHLKINLFVDELKKQTFILKNNSFLLFCTPVLYLEEKTKKSIRLKPSLKEIAIAGKGHGLDFIAFEKATLGNPLGLLQGLTTQKMLDNDSLSCYPYFDNSTHFHSSLFVGLDTSSQTIKNEYKHLKIQGNSFADLVPFFENTQIKFEDKLLKASSILSPTKRRDLKNISKKAFDVLSFLSFHEFNLTKKEFINQLVSILDYFYSEKDYQDSSFKKLFPLFENIEYHYEVSPSQTEFDNTAFIQKKLIVSLESEKVKGLSLALISKFIQGLAIHSSTINSNINEVKIQLK